VFSFNRILDEIIATLSSLVIRDQLDFVVRAARSPSRFRLLDTNVFQNADKFTTFSVLRFVAQAEPVTPWSRSEKVHAKKSDNCRARN
jgi:hypothetical protein